MQQLSGILFGRPGGPVDPAQFGEYDDAIMRALQECERVDVPVVTRMDFGHTDPVFIIPYGAQAEIDCDRQGFSILDPGVNE